MALDTQETSWEDWNRMIDFRMFIFEELGGMSTETPSVLYTYGIKGGDWNDKLWTKVMYIVKDKSWH